MNVCTGRQVSDCSTHADTCLHVPNCYLFRFLFPALPPFPLPPFPEGRFHRVPHVAHAFNRISLNAGKLNIDKHTEQTTPVDIGNPVSKQVALRSTLDALR